MAYVKIIYQNSPSTATPINAENLNHMDDQIALNDQRLTEIETSYVKSFNGRKGEVVPEDGDYNIGQIALLTGAQVGQVPVVTNIGTEEDPKLVFRMGAGGGGGHSIIDSEGNTMPQESAMQFADSFVSDDDVNGKTIVENIKEVDPADYDSTTDEGIIVCDDGNDVPIGEIEEDVVSVTADGVKTFGTLLSEIFNNEKFDITKVTLNSKFTIGGTIYNVLSISTTSVSFTYSSGSKSSPYLMTAIAVISATPALFESRESTYHESINDKPSNGTVITLHYGTSNGIVELNTDARHCMMSDGVTSVESRLLKYVVDSTWSSGVTLESRSYILRDGDYAFLQLSGTVGQALNAYQELQIGTLLTKPLIDTLIPIVWANNSTGYIFISASDGSIKVCAFASTVTLTTFYANGVYRIA